MVECVICLDDVDDQQDAKLKCKHTMHLMCVKQLHDPRCPCCRSDLESDKLTQNDIEKMCDRRIADRMERIQAPPSEELIRMLQGDPEEGFFARTPMNLSRRRITAPLPQELPAEFMSVIVENYNNLVGMMASQKPPNPQDFVVGVCTGTALTAAIFGGVNIRCIKNMLMRDMPNIYQNFSRDALEQSINAVLG